MAVFRIERTKDYTVMSNHHLRNHELSLKAKGLLSMMLYDAVFTLEGYSLLVAIVWLPKFLFGSILMFLTVSPFVFVAMKTKGFVAPMIGSAVIVMGSAALSNQEWGALYPWTATYFLVQGKLQSTGYPTLLSVSIIILVSAVGFLMTFHHFKKEDLK